MRIVVGIRAVGLSLCLCALSSARADEARPPRPEHDAAALANTLNNPLAAMISVPLQSNFDFNIGPEDGWRYQLNIQPVVPIPLDDQWTVLSRTILPVIHQEDAVPGTGSQSGLGDITQSFFFAPTPEPGGIIWGVGPALLIPTATEDLLGTEKLGIGPTAIALKQAHGLTYGMLVNHIWSVAGEGGRADVNSTFLQPFVSYTTPEAWTFGVNSETTYDWHTEQWSVPVNAFVSKLVKFDDQPVSFTLGARYWAESPETGPEDWGARFVVTFLFPE